MRPDAGTKTFTGQLLDLEDFDRFWANDVVCTAKAADLVIVSSPKEIQGEWRYVVSSDGKIVSCTTYLYQQNRTRIPSAPTGATELCQAALRCGYHPDPLYTMDVAQTTAGPFRLLELNAFSTSALYACRKEPIVMEVERLLKDAPPASASNDVMTKEAKRLTERVQALHRHLRADRRTAKNPTSRTNTAK